MNSNRQPTTERQPSRQGKFTKPTKYRLSLCFEGLYYAVVLGFILGGGILRGINLLFVLAGMMLGPLIYNWRMVDLILNRIRVRRILPDGICAGDLLVVEFEATNTARRGNCSAVVVNDAITCTANQEAVRIGDDRAAAFFPMVKPGESEIQSYQGRLMERGRYHFGPFRISTRFPLGLVSRSATVNDEDELIVFPRPGRLLPRWKHMSQAQLIGTGGARSRQGLVEGDFYGLRDYRSGDSRRWIHWRTSARRNTLAVRQFEQPRTQDIALLLDLWQPERPGDDQRDNVELAISFAATIAEDLCRHGGNRLGIGIAGEEVSWKQGVSSRPLLTEVMEQLALASASPKDQLPVLLEKYLSEIPQGTKAVVISTRDVDLHDTYRFANVWDDPNLRTILREIEVISAAAGDFQEYFETV